MSTHDEDRQRAALAQAIKRARQELPAQLELIELQAQLARARYLALIKQGFNPDEALRLCTQAIAV